MKGDETMAYSKSVSVAYKNVDGIYFFCSADSHLTGLLAAATDIPAVVRGQ
jgi:hypothetical protein